MLIPKICYPHIALHAARNLLMCMGFWWTVALLGNLPVYLVIAVLAFLGCLFTILYKSEIAYRTRRMERSTYR